LHYFYPELILFTIYTSLLKKSIGDPFKPRQIYKLIRKQLISALIAKSRASEVYSKRITLQTSQGAGSVPPRAYKKVKLGKKIKKREVCLLSGAPIYRLT
jgi:hypothetical protein